MDTKERVKLLRSLELFATLPDARLESLAALLEPATVEDGRAFIVESEKSDGLYCIASGRVRVTKRLGGGKAEKDLAFLGPGDCLGEMEFLHGSARSASAYAQGRAELLRLKTADLTRWLEADPAVAAKFFSGLAEIQSKRLRRTSDEVAMLSDLSQLLVSAQATPEDLLAHALERVTPHLQGRWSSEARLYNLFDDEITLVSRCGAPIGPDGPESPAQAPAKTSWTDGRTLTFALRSPKRLFAIMRFRSASDLDDAARAEAERTLGAAARLLASALENIDYRNDEALRERLRSRSHGASL